MSTSHTRRRARILAAGGSQLALLLGKDATQALEAIVARTGETKTQAVERLLIGDSYQAQPSTTPPVSRLSCDTASP